MPERRTYADRSEYLKMAVAKRRRVIRQRIVEYKGGRCVICGYDKCSAALELHHRKSSEKTFAISGQGLTRAWDKVRVEADKCELICANCHREVHHKQVQPPWVTKE